MTECRIHIVLLGHSPILSEGISAFLLQTRKHYVIHRLAIPRDLEKLEDLARVQVIIVNPRLLTERREEFVKMQLRAPGAAWIGLMQSDSEPLPDGLAARISLQDPGERIASKVEEFTSGCTCHKQDTGELTEREIEVLALLVKGYSNKDVAEKLFISPHTVITHRKNLVEKTGIRSLSGLTIYAITKNIISLDSLSGG